MPWAGWENFRAQRDTDGDQGGPTYEGCPRWSPLSCGPSLKAGSLSLPAGPTGPEGFLVQMASGTCFLEVGASSVAQLSIIETIL